MLGPEYMSAIAIRHTGVGARSNTQDKLSARRLIFFQEVSDLKGVRCRYGYSLFNTLVKSG
ncbi:TPA: hypothetical protein JD264_18070 [Serratia fonticola]|nr:hypothetical protein [Serratia fonticola]